MTPPGASQQRQERLGHPVGAEEVDGQVPVHRSTIAQVIGKPDAGVVDQDIESFDLADGCLNLRRFGHVQGQRRDPPIRVDQRPARTGIHPPRASPEGILDQRPPYTAIAPGHQNRSVCDCHVSCSSSAVFPVVARRPVSGAPPTKTRRTPRDRRGPAYDFQRSQRVRTGDRLVVKDGVGRACLASGPTPNAPLNLRRS
jgi:hypothetical protein